MFALITFVSTNEVAIVPVNWLKGNQSFWPITKDVQKLVRASQEPKADWPLCEVNIKAVYVTYEEAQHNEKIYEATSNVESQKNSENLRCKRKYIELTENCRTERTEERSGVGSYPDTRRYLPSVKKEIEDIYVEEVCSTPEQYYMVLPENSQVPLNNKQCSCNCAEGIKSLKEQMSQMKAVMRDQAQALTEISAAVNKLDGNYREPIICEESSFPIQLPIASRDDLLKLEEAMNDENVKYDLLEKLTQVGGTHLGNTVRRMLTRLLTNEVANQYSWVGAKGKEIFKDLKICNVLFDTVRKNPRLITSTDQDIETAIKDWLRHAKTRDSNCVSHKVFAIVGFLEESSIEVVPTQWIINNSKAKWPNEISLNLISKYIRECKTACTDWKTVSIKIYGFSNSFKVAKRKAETVIKTSAISSDSSDDEIEHVRKKKVPLRFQTSPQYFDDDSNDGNSTSLISKKRIKPNFPTTANHGEYSKKNTFNSTQKMLSHNSEDLGVKDANQTAMFQKVLEYMEEMKTSINELHNKVDHLLMEKPIKAEHISGVYFLPPDVRLPLDTEEELQQFERRLKEDSDFYGVMVRYLAGVGNGKTPSAFILSITKRILDQQIAMQYSRYGRKGKKSFSEFVGIVNVILDAATLQFQNSEKEFLSDLFGKALAGAIDWGGRKIRPSENSLNLEFLNFRNLHINAHM